MGHVAGSAIVEVDDAGVLLDADTPEDLARLRERAAGEGLPDEARCLELLAGNGLPEPRIAHSRVVAAVAAGARRRPQRARAAPVRAARARGRAAARHRPRAAAPRGRGRRPARAAAATRAWPPSCAGTWNCPADAGEDVDEAQVVYLADKLVQGDRVVGLEERFAVRLVRHRGDPEALAAVRRRKAQAETVLANVEKLLGRPVEDVLPARARPAAAAGRDPLDRQPGRLFAGRGLLLRRAVAARSRGCCARRSRRRPRPGSGRA